MLLLSPDARLYIYTANTDMRKSIHGLMMLLTDIHQVNPQSGDVFIFTNRYRDKIKILLWDHNGFVLYYKTLQRGRFNYSKYLNGDKIEITEAQLRALLMGLDFYLLGQHPLETCKDFF